MPAKVVGVSIEPDSNGDHWIELSMPDGSTATASLPPSMAATIVAALQPHVVEQARRIESSVSFPSAEVYSLSIIRAGTGAQLLVSTLEIGHWILRMSDEWVEGARHVIDRIRTVRQNSIAISDPPSKSASQDSPSSRMSTWLGGAIE
jgi:hypothetical protein